MFRRHFSDEQLVAHLNGELPRWKRARLEAHLASCWRCRSRHAGFDEQMRRLAMAFEEFEAADFPDDDWAARQIERFRQRLLCEQRVTALPNYVPSRRALRLVPLALAAAVLVALSVIELARFDAKKSAKQIVLAAAQMERAAAAQALHERLRVELVRQGKRSDRTTGKLEIWSDPGSGRYSAQWWQGERLVYAVWRPRPGEQHWYGLPHARTERPFRLTSFLAKAGTSAELEGLLVGWLTSQRWQPLLITEEISHFLSQQGVQLRAGRVNVEGEQRFWIEAWRKLGGSLVTLKCEFRLRDHQLRLARMRVEDHGGAVEILLAVERLERVAKGRLPAEVFMPLSAGAASHGLKPVRPLRQAPQPASPRFPVIVALSEQERSERELAVRYALHRVRACLGDPIEIEVTLGGMVAVHGLVHDDGRREAIRQALEELDYVKVDLRTEAETVDAVTLTPASEQHPWLAVRRELVIGGKVLIEERMAAHLRQYYPEAEIPRRIAAVANQATEASAALLAHAWAARKLHAAFPAERAAQLRLPDRLLVEDMLHDHLAAISAGAGSALQLLETFLGKPQYQPFAHTESGLPQAMEKLFELAAEADRVVRGIFASTGLRAGEENQAPYLLVDQLARLQQEAEWIQALARAEFRTALSSTSPAARGREAKELVIGVKP